MISDLCNRDGVRQTNPLIIGLVLIALAGCQTEPTSTTLPETASSGKQTGTAGMVALLEDINSRADPNTNIYASDLNLAQVQAEEPPAMLSHRVQYDTKLARQHLLAGESEEAIRILEEVRELLEIRPHTADLDFKLLIYNLLGLSYLRLAEQQNCLFNHTAGSCILPIEPEAIHQLQEGSTGAIENYAALLNYRPDDLETMWLMNIAYMTLGKHPSEVPAKWLIPLDVFESDYDIKRFRDVAQHVGLDATTLGGGSISEDFDRDGDLDVMISSPGIRDQMQFFLNQGDGTFSDHTEIAGLTGLVGGINLVHGDYNNDGFPDVYILRGGWLGPGGMYPNSLLRNNGDATFSDVTEEAGLLSLHPTQSAAWADFDNDGWLDLFVANESVNDDRHPTELFRNNGDGTFTELAARAGANPQGFFKGVTWGDIDNDGDPDLYLSTLYAPNILLRNDWSTIQQFTDITEEAGVSDPIESFPTWFWDYDNDGWEDILVLTYSGGTSDVANQYLGNPIEAELPALYRNRGDGTFEHVTQQARLDKSLTAMGSNFGDLDNDGFLDMYIGTGEPNMRALVPNRMFRNNGGRHFQDVTTSGGFGHLQKGHGVSFADFDHDGDQDVHAVIGGAYTGDTYQNALFENPGHNNGWINLELTGTTSNRSAIGARVAVRVQTAQGIRTIHRTVSSGGSFGGSTFRQEIGLGRAASIQSLIVTWPASGTTQTFSNVETNRFYTLTEGDSELVLVTRNPIPFSKMAGSSTPHH